MDKYFRVTVLSTLLVTSAALSAQVYEKRAAVVGNRGEWGKCTVEVVVDKSAEVMVFNDRGIIRTINGGQPATWRRLECTGPMPINMRDFRFEGRDGRGQVRLIQDPRSNHGRAMVHIDDPQAGSEGYTFDLLWRGGTAFGDWERDRPYRDWERYRADGWHLDGVEPERRIEPERRDEPERRIEPERREPERREPDRRDADRRFEGGLDFRGPGSGALSSSRGDERLTGCDIKIREDGDIRVNFRTRRETEIAFTGKIVRREGDRVTAEVSNERISGTMFLDVDHGRVRHVTMSGGRDRDRFDLNWRDETWRDEGRRD